MPELALFLYRSKQVKPQKYIFSTVATGQEIPFNRSTSYRDGHRYTESVWLLACYGLVKRAAHAGGTSVQRLQKCFSCARRVRCPEWSLSLVPWFAAGVKESNCLLSPLHTKSNKELSFKGVTCHVWYLLRKALNARTKCTIFLVSNPVTVHNELNAAKSPLACAIPWRC